MPAATADATTAHDGAREATRDRALRLGLAAFLGAMTVLHLVEAETFEAMVPTWLPGSPTSWNLLATTGEGASAALLASRRTARAGGYLAAATFVGVFLANVEAARIGGYPMATGWLGTRTVAVARLPLQIPLVLWALRVARRAGGRD